MSTAQKRLFALIAVLAVVSLGIGLYLWLNFDPMVRDAVQSDKLREMRQQIEPKPSLP
ncbi:MAG: hypothetical protein WC685_08420 [Methylobacter sp.]|jgi:hypothetical protein|nr:hypothetical protein [Candidatus Neomarinimicrobiota bacterium]